MKTLEKYKNHKIVQFTKGDLDYNSMKEMLLIVTPNKEEILQPIFTIEDAKKYIDTL